MTCRSRLTSFFRIFVIIPIWIVPGTESGGAWGWPGGTARGVNRGYQGTVNLAGQRPGQP
jgi:hypothetical protein